MAEALAVVGVVSSIVELVDFASKCVKRLEEFRRGVTEVPELYRDVTLQLPLLIQSLRRTQMHIDLGHYDPQDTDALQSIVQGCQIQIALLEDLLNKAIPKQHDSKVARSCKALYSLSHEQALAKINSKISGCIEKLILFQSAQASDFIIRSVREMLHPIRRGHTDLSLQLDVVGKDQTEERPESSSDETLTIGQRSKKAGLALYTQKRRRFSIFISFARLNVLWALQAGLDVAWGTRSYSISPMLELKRMVRYTSPGFQILWKCQCELMDFSAVPKELEILFQTGQASPLDIDPSGQTWIDKLFQCIPGSNTDQYIAIIRMLYEYGARMNYNTSLLDMYSSWVWHKQPISLLKAVLPLDDGLLEENWDYRDGDLSFMNHCSDAFVLHFLGECSNNAFGAWGQTPLMDIVLGGSKVEIIKLLEDKRALLGKNVFGQSAIHLAVRRPAVLSLLLEAGADSDARDKHNRTPLDYAAVYGYVDSLLLLLEAGANPIYRDENCQLHIVFLNLARERGHWDLITKAFSFLSASRCHSDSFLKGELDHLIIEYARSRCSMEAEGLKCIFKLGADPNLILNESQNPCIAFGRTLLDRIFDYEAAKILFEAGFKNIDHLDSGGNSSLMLASKRKNLSLFQAILKKSGNINQQNVQGHSALHLCAIEIRKFSCPSFTLDIETLLKKISMSAWLLEKGADSLLRDTCRCPCAKNGCSASTLLLRSNEADLSVHAWLLEWLLMLREFRDARTVQQAVFDLVRAIKFEKLEMTHVCCRKSSSSSYRDSELDEEEVEEILDEEKHLIRELEDFMAEICTLHDERPEEELLHVISQLHVPEKNHHQDEWFYVAWQQWQGSSFNEMIEANVFSDYRPFPQIEQRKLDVYSPNEPARHQYYIHEPTDTFVREKEPEKWHKVPAEQVYMDWLNHIYENCKNYDSPRPITEEWYTGRKLWVGRLAEAIETAKSQTIVEEINNDLLIF